MVFLLIFSLASCGRSKADMYLDDEIAAHFSDCISVEEVLDDIRKIKLDHDNDLSGLHSEKSYDEEKDTAIVNYYNAKGEKVYTFYEGFGEENYDCYTDSASGRRLTVNYYDDGDKNVSIECDDYGVKFSSVDENEIYGAQTVSVCIKRAFSSHLPEEMTCFYEGGRCTAQYSFWFDESGYHRSESWIDEEGKLQSYDDLIYEHVTQAPKTDSTMLTDEGVYIMPEFVMGRHRLFYTGDKNDAKWYLQTDFVRTFGSEAEAEAFRKKYSLEPSEPQGDEGENITQRTGELTVPIAKDCENFEWLMVIYEINDSYYLSVEVNENGEIASVTNGIYSCY